MSDFEKDYFPEENLSLEREDVENQENQETKDNVNEDEDELETGKSIHGSLVRLGFINFDNSGAENTSSEVMVSAEHRRYFRRDVYVGIRDIEQELSFLGRVVEGPFHSPHEVGMDSAITRTTVLHPDRTQFRPSYYVSGTIEILGQLREGEQLVPSPTRPRPYSEIYIFPPERLQKFLKINGDFYLGHLMGYDKIAINVDVNNKNFLPRNIGIFGTVGSGKSNTTQVIMEEAVNAGWAVVVIDVEGEYVKINKPTSDTRLIKK
jgi:DNA helicase HerA-like ATPase